MTAKIFHQSYVTEVTLRFTLFIYFAIVFHLL